MCHLEFERKEKSYSSEQVKRINEYDIYLGLLYIGAIKTSSRKFKKNYKYFFSNPKCKKVK